MRAKGQMGTKCWSSHRHSRARLRTEPYSCPRPAPCSGSYRTVYRDGPHYNPRISNGVCFPLRNLKTEIVNKAVVSKRDLSMFVQDKSYVNWKGMQPGRGGRSPDDHTGVRTSCDPVSDGGEGTPTLVLLRPVTLSPPKHGDCENMQGHEDSTSTPQFHMSSAGESLTSAGAETVREAWGPAQPRSPPRRGLLLDFNSHDVLCLSPISGGDIDELVENGVHEAEETVPSQDTYQTGTPQGDTEHLGTGSLAQDDASVQDEGYLSNVYQEVPAQGVSPFQGGCLPATCTSSPVRRSPLSSLRLPLVAGAHLNPACSEVGGAAGNPERLRGEAVPPLVVKGESADDESSQHTRKPEQECPVQVTSAGVDSNVKKNCVGESPEKPQARGHEPYRPAVFKSEAHWRREKQRYLDAVSSHMAECSHQAGGVLSELYNLMSAVAHQGVESSNTSWQHPSDFTRRNYRPRTRSTVSLDQWWQQQNSRFHRRFSAVPFRFHRSRLF